MSLDPAPGASPEHLGMPQLVGKGGPDRTDGQVLQILATEHWSLLATRSMSWNESFNRIGTFLALLSGATVALALVAQATGFREGFTLFALLLLPVVLFVGVATYIRLCAINNEDLVWVAGMNRLRHAYLEARPEIAAYFVTSVHDDMAGISTTLAFGQSGQTQSLLAQLGHGLVTMPGMLMVVDSAISAVLGGVVAVALGLGTTAVVVVGLVVFLTAFALLARYEYGNISAWKRRWPAVFPSPSAAPRDG